MSVDYSPQAIHARLRLAARLTNLTTGERLEAKIDYSPAAIERRLRQVDVARRACLTLMTAELVDAVESSWETS